MMFMLKIIGLIGALALVGLAVVACFFTDYGK
jgi:hypothetical protein